MRAQHGTLLRTVGASPAVCAHLAASSNWMCLTDWVLMTLAAVILCICGVQAAMAAITGGAPAPDPAKKEGEGGDKK